MSPQQLSITGICTKHRLIHRLQQTKENMTGIIPEGMKRKTSTLTRAHGSTSGMHHLALRGNKARLIIQGKLKATITQTIQVPLKSNLQ